MASIEVVKPVIPPPPSNDYLLRITQDELDTLWAILRLVGGHPTETGRRYANSVYDAINPHNRVRPENVRSKSPTGSLHFGHAGD